MGLSAIFGKMASFAVLVISSLGYPGVAVLMALESMVTPLPSELVMPFAGFLVSQGKLNFWLVVAAGGIGSLVGSLISYFAGSWGGKAFVLKYGKYLLLNEHDLDMTHRFFARHGEKAIFISRFIPIIRHLISVPAGIGKMNIKKFSVYTLAGATIWCGILTYAGMKLGENWEKLHSYSEPLSIITVIVLGIVGMLYVYRHLKRK